ncbi:MAG: SBBP repeat-containing protein [Bacteroidia bacterium]
MKAVYTFIALLFISLQSQCQNYSWAKQAGGTDADEAYSVAYDNSGNSYITGSFSGTATFQTTMLTSAGGTDMFLAKYDPSGNLIWVQQAGHNANQQGHMVATDNSGNVYVAGEFEGSITFGAQTLTSSGLMDIFLVKYDAGGSVQWVFNGGSSGMDAANSLKTDAAGNIYMTGNFENVLYFGPLNLISTGYTDIFVTKFNSFGGMLWLVRAGGVLEDDGHGLAVDNSGNVCITGYFQQVATFGSLTLNAVNTMKDIFIAKLTTNGIFIWAVRAGGLDDDGGYEADADAAGNFYVAGSFKGTSQFGSININSNNGTEDMFVTMVDGSGIFYWATGGGGLGTDKAYSLAWSATGKLFCTGSYEGTATFGSTTLNSAGDKDIFITSINTGGSFNWTWSAGNAGYDRGYGIESNAAGSVWVTGRFEQTTSFGATTLTSAGLNDVFLTRIETMVSVPELKNDFIIHVFPNPFNGELIVTSNQFGVKKIEIINRLGEIVSDKQLQAASNNFKLQTSNLSPGIYFLKITGDKESAVFKIIKQ